jgi:hypothetical protein
MGTIREFSLEICQKILRFTTVFVFLFVVTVSVVVPSAARAEASPEREFVMSCTYGVLAGTLVGAASLAFTDKPGDNLQRVARGASIGLYIGIGLGYYTIYVVPKQIQKEEEQRLDESTGGEASTNLKMPSFLVFPLVDEKGVDGVGAFWQIARF